MQANIQEMIPRMRMLTDGQIEKIHLAACEVLERTGTIIHNEQARELLHAHGAHIGPDKRVFIPSYMVDQAIQRAPRRIVLCNRDGERKIFLEDHNVYFGCNPDNPEYIDPYTGKRRAFTSQDGRDMAKVIDYTQNIDFVLNACFSADVDTQVADRVIIRQMMLNQRKTIGFSCTNADSLLDIIDMAAIVAGGHDNLRRNPYIFHIQEPISPLVHDDNSIKEIMICAEKGIPLVYYPMPMGGATAPATPAGLLAQNHAESMTGLVIQQLVKPGAAFVTGGVASIMDMRTSKFAYGAPEMYRQCAALADIAHYFNLPFWGTAGCVDSRTVDQQAGAEIAMSCLMAGLSGANLVHDTGLMDQATVTCPEVLLLADEVQGLVRNILKGIPMDDENLALDIIDKVGPGGQYLSEEHTYRHFRNFWQPNIFDRSVMQKGELGGPTLSEKLNKKAIEVIEEHEVPLLDKEKVDELLQLEKKWLDN